MSYDGGGSIYAVGMRITRLNADGTFASGANAMLVSDALVKIDFHLEYEAPDAIQRVNGAGKVCLYYQPPKTVKGLVVDSLEVCSEDPELEEMLGGGTVFTSGSGSDVESIGYQAPLVGSTPNPHGISVEAWSSAVVDGALAPNLPYMHWVLPRLDLSQQGRTLENDALAPAWEGSGSQNPNWGDGPTGDFLQDSGAVYQWVRTGSVPTPTDGWVAVPSGT